MQKDSVACRVDYSSFTAFLVRHTNATYLKNTGGCRTLIFLCSVKLYPLFVKSVKNTFIYKSKYC